MLDSSWLWIDFTYPLAYNFYFHTHKSAKQVWSYIGSFGGAWWVLWVINDGVSFSNPGVCVFERSV